MERKFFILWNPDSDLPPRAKFVSREVAQMSADLMADKFYPDKFYVCEAGSFSIGQPRKLTRTKLKDV